MSALAYPVYLTEDMFGPFAWVLNQNYDRTIINLQNTTNNTFKYSDFLPRVGFSVYAAASQSIPTSLPAQEYTTQILFDAKEFDTSETGEPCFDLTNSWFVVPVGYDGIYCFMASVTINSLPDGTTRTLRVSWDQNPTITGGIVGYSTGKMKQLEYDIVGAASNSAPFGVCMANLAAGDKVLLTMAHNAGGSRSTAGGRAFAYFSGWKVR